MKDSVVYILYKLLREHKIIIDEQEIKFQLLSHPTYPSLHAVTGVLDHFNIKNLAVQAPNNKETLDQLDTQFLTQVKDDTGEHFALFKKNDNKIHLIFSRDESKTLSEEEFLSIWTGIILAIEPDENEIKTGSRDIKKRIIGAVFTVLLFVSLFFFFRPSLPKLLHFALSCIGISFSVLIILKELGLPSSALNRFCSPGQSKVSCDAVLNSKGASILGNIKLSDIGIVYFSGLVFSSFLLLLNGSSFDFIYILGLLAIPFTVYSVFYQFLIVKNWCTLCLAVVVTLWLQIIPIYLSGFSIQQLSFETSSILLLLFSFSIITVLWSYLLPLLKKQIELQSLKIEYHKFKRNYSIFDTLLSKSETLPVGLINKHEIVLGNKTENPKLSITIITNPSCGHCKEVHTLIEQLLQQNSEQIQIIIRFNVLSSNLESDAAKITARITELYHQQGEKTSLEAMHDAYIELNSQQWLSKWGACNNKDFFNVLQNQNEWCINHNKNFTPEIIIQGKSYPKEYNRKELLFFVEDLLE